MFDSSKDILYIVIAGCIGIFTAFVCWMFYYLIRILKNTSQIIEEIRGRLDDLSAAIGSVREKVDQLSGIMNLFSDGVTGLVKKMVSRKADAWVDNGTDTLNSAAKEAVDKAVDMTAAKMKKMAQKIKK